MHCSNTQVIVTIRSQYRFHKTEQNANFKQAIKSHIIREKTNSLLYYFHVNSIITVLKKHQSRKIVLLVVEMLKESQLPVLFKSD